MSVAVLNRWDDLAVRVIRELLPYGVVPAQDDEVGGGRALAAELIGGTIVSEADFRRVHRRCGMALFLTHEEGRLTGMMATVPLTLAGERAVWDGSFQALAPAARHVARRGEPARAIYGWGMAAATREAARRLMEGTQAMLQGATAHLPTYSRAATAAGERALREKLGFVEMPGSTAGLMWSPPTLSRKAAA